MASVERGASQTRTVARHIKAGNGGVEPNGSQGVYFTQTLPGPADKSDDKVKNPVPWDGSVGFGNPYNSTLFVMRGYYVTGSTWEVWTSRGSPSLTPPSGHTLVDKTVEAMRQ